MRTARAEDVEGGVGFVGHYGFKAVLRSAFPPWYSVSLAEATLAPRPPGHPRECRFAPFAPPLRFAKGAISPLEGLRLDFEFHEFFGVDYLAVVDLSDVSNAFF